MQTSISFVSTQMQLINCIEYITKNNLTNNKLVFLVASKVRKDQLFQIYNIPCNKNLFIEKPVVFEFSTSKLLNIFYSLLILFRVYLWTIFRQFDVCILGNYKSCYGRYFWYRNKSAKRVVVDDGLCTPIWYEIRASKGFKGISEIFYDNRFVKRLLINKEDRMIPESVLFFSIYTDIKNLHDEVEYNEYLFLQNNIKQYPISEAFSNCSFVFLGQPYHTRNVISYKRYNEYLRQTYNYLGRGRALYYPHPEERGCNWMEDDVKMMYEYIPYGMSFEIFALSMPQNSTIVSFQTSVQPILLKLCPSFKQYAVFLNEVEESDTPLFNEMVEAYRYLETTGISIIRF